MITGRRNLIKMALGSTALAAGWQLTTSAAQAAASYKHTPSTLKGSQNSLISVGGSGRRHVDVFLQRIPSANPASPEYSRYHSCITEISLTDDTIKQTAIPMESAHAAMRLPNSNLAITAHHKGRSLLLDADHKVIKKIDAPEGYLFGGHGQFFPEHNTAILAVRHADPKSIKDTGRLLVFDADTFALQDTIDSKGIHPHEIRILPDRKEFVVTHYGDVNTSHPKGLAFHCIEPKLSVFSLDDFSAQRHYPQPVDAIYTHMDVGSAGDVYAITNQYLRIAKLRGDERLKKMKELNITHNHNLSATSNSRGRIAVPGPFIKVNPKTGEREEFFVSDEINIRSQSVAAHLPSKRVFATYVYSNTLLMVDEAAKKVTPIDAQQYGISSIRGVSAIPNSDYIAIADQEKGVSLVNAHTLEQVKHFSSDVLGAPHIFAV